jgi:hypothetical protein
MSLFDWHRNHTYEEKVELVGQREAIRDLCSFMVSELCEISQLYKDYGNKEEQ